MIMLYPHHDLDGRLSESVVDSKSMEPSVLGRFLGEDGVHTDFEVGCRRRVAYVNV